MLKKEEVKGKCPFRNFKVCESKCVFFRTGTRYNELTEEVLPVEICAINVIADNIEALHNRTYQLQKEVGETKNVVAFGVMANMGMTSKAEAERQAKQVLLPFMEELQKKEELSEK